MRPIQSIVHCHHIQNNLQQLRALLPQGVKQFSVLKANAYGHGIDNLYSSIQTSDGFAVLEMSEAQLLRQLGWTKPILLLEGLFSPDELKVCDENQLWLVVHQFQQINWLENYAFTKPTEVFVKINTGMNRLGFEIDQFYQIHNKLKNVPNIKKITCMSHYYQGSDAESLLKQQHLTKRIMTDGFNLSFSNSAAYLNNNNNLLKHESWVRLGIGLYGSSPYYPQFPSTHWNLKPTKSLRSKVIAVQDVEPGEGIGYNHQYLANKPLKIGVVACGYADGYPRHAGHDTPVLVNGIRSVLVGQISMDMLTVILPEGTGLDSEITLWGQSSCGVILPIDEVAESAHTIAHDLLCAQTWRVPTVVERASKL